MKERPILFSGPMVRAVLQGRKTQTRRIMKPQPNLQFRPASRVEIYQRKPGNWEVKDRLSMDGFSSLDAFNCPYGRPGDLLWVRETWARDESGAYLYRSDAIQDDSGEIGGSWVWEKHFPGPWRPSIHMPRAASRILLEVVEVRVERLNEISEENAKAEGVEPIPWPESNHPLYPIYGSKGDWGNERYTLSPISSFKALWQTINGPESWNINPWVWVITFNRITP